MKKEFVNIITVDKIKLMGKRLKKDLLINQNLSLDLNSCYNMIARQLGFKNYNTAIAIIEKANNNLKQVVYEFSFKNKVLKEKILDELKTLLPILKDKNPSLYSTIEHDNGNGFSLYMSCKSSDLSIDLMSIDIIILKHFKKELADKRCLVNKRTFVSRLEYCDFNSYFKDGVENNNGKPIVILS